MRGALPPIPVRLRNLIVISNVRQVSDELHVIFYKGKLYFVTIFYFSCLVIDFAFPF
jgi:hypothetical protein